MSFTIMGIVVPALVFGFSYYIIHLLYKHFSKKSVEMNSYQKGKYTFESGLCCAESVLKVIAEEEGIKSDLLPGIAAGFCSGISRTCNMCGALTGGILALNPVYGRKSSDDSKEENYSAVQELMSEFKREFGTVNCQELLGCNLGTEEGQQIFHEKELGLKCAEFVGRSAEIVRGIIDTNKIH